MRGRLLFNVAFLLFFLTGYSQEVRIRGGFVEDQMKLGENVHYWMSARYPEQTELFLPDSSFNFAPFEYADKKYYESRLSNGVIVDSAIYTLQSYEIDKTQYLQLPAFILKNGDTTKLLTAQDSILLFQLTKEVSDTTKLKENIAYQDVPTRFNYPLMWIILGSFLVLSLLIFLIFGKKIRKAFKLRKLRKEYESFSEKLSGYIQSLKEQPRREVAEKALIDWKSFLEKLENKPFTKLTTKEIVALGYTAELSQTLKNIDRSVYGKAHNDGLYREFQAVEDFTQHRYSIIKDQIKNG